MYANYELYYTVMFENVMLCVAFTYFDEIFGNYLSCGWVSVWDKLFFSSPQSQVLEKGPTTVQNPILNILHCMLHYIDINTAAAQLVNGDLLRVIAKYIEVRRMSEGEFLLNMSFVAFLMFFFSEGEANMSGCIFPFLLWTIFPFFVIPFPI